MVSPSISLFPIITSYLNQLKENRPLDRGAIRETTPTLCQQSEWGIAEPPAIQQVVVNVSSLFAVDVERGRQHTGGNGGSADTHVR